MPPFCTADIRAQRLTASKLYSVYFYIACNRQTEGAQRLPASKLYSDSIQDPARTTIAVLNAYRHQSYIQDDYPNFFLNLVRPSAQRLPASKLYSVTNI